MSSGDVAGGSAQDRDREQLLAETFVVLADVATIGILQRRSTHRSAMMAEQLQHALNSRVVIEQAKGVLAERNGVDMDTAFNALRRYARNHNRKLSELAMEVVRGEIDPTAVQTGRRVT